LVSFSVIHLHLCPVFSFKLHGYEKYSRNTPRPNACSSRDYDKNLGRLTKTVRRGIDYDNNGYTLVDAMVKEKTDHDLTHWVRELIFKPLDMQGTLSCLSSRDSCPRGLVCYEPVTSVEAVHAGSKWPIWKGGKLTGTWISNAFFASANDMTKFLSMLLRNGTSEDGKSILSLESVNLLFYPHLECTKAMESCLGVHMFGLGAGCCDGADKSLWGNSPTAHLSAPAMSERYFASEKYSKATSLCLAPKIWGWASSYGSRFSILRDKNVACMFMMNQFSGNTNNGEGMSSRAHFLAHNASAVLRHVFPLE